MGPSSDTRRRQNEGLQGMLPAAVDLEILEGTNRQSSPKQPVAPSRKPTPTPEIRTAVYHHAFDPSRAGLASIVAATSITAVASITAATSNVAPHRYR